MKWIFGAALLCFVIAGVVQILIWINKIREPRRAEREEQQRLERERKIREEEELEKAYNAVDWSK